MRFDAAELHIDWGSIERARSRQRRPFGPKILPLILFLGASAMLVWLASPYIPITKFMLSEAPPIDLRSYLDEHHQYPPPGSFVEGKELTLGFKGAEWKRIRRFAIVRSDTIYIQVIGAVCPYEMPRDRCRKVLVEVARDDPDFATFKPPATVTVSGRLYRIDQKSEFAPLIGWLAKEMAMDADGAFVIAHGERPGLGRDGLIFWALVLLALLLNLILVIRVLRR
jgi:hypothetical protein